MKFEINEGCISFNFFVDGKRYDDLSREEKEKVVDHVLSKVREKMLDNYIGLQGVLEHFEYESFEYGTKCESCGDTPSRTVINI
jgi:hypothetical protein